MERLGLISPPRVLGWSVMCSEDVHEYFPYASLMIICTLLECSGIFSPTKFPQHDPAVLSSGLI